jgi:hypothetical protein
MTEGAVTRISASLLATRTAGRCRGVAGRFRVVTDVVDEPAVFHSDPPRDLPGEVHVVGHDQEGHLVLVVDAKQEVVDLVRGAGVEVAGRLVGQQQARAHDQRAGDRHALLLATGELAGAVVQAV